MCVGGQNLTFEVSQLAQCCAIALPVDGCARKDIRIKLFPRTNVCNEVVHGVKRPHFMT